MEEHSCALGLLPPVLTLVVVLFDVRTGFEVKRIHANSRTVFVEGCNLRLHVARAMPAESLEGRETSVPRLAPVETEPGLRLWVAVAAWVTASSTVVSVSDKRLRERRTRQLAMFSSSSSMVLLESSAEEAETAAATMTGLCRFVLLLLTTEAAGGELAIAVGVVVDVVVVTNGFPHHSQEPGVVLSRQPVQVLLVSASIHISLSLYKFLFPEQ
ncbi:hypothetical protein BHE74_00009079 [Ensete ventricosum]|nr:hypothetical protein BHE74_00009079 [Ensete ventricosum]